jgi:hypothetical protein
MFYTSSGQHTPTLLWQKLRNKKPLSLASSWAMLKEQRSKLFEGSRVPSVNTMILGPS